MIDKCDICEKETDNLVDYYVMLCQECKVKHTDITLLRIIGRYKNRYENVRPRNM